MDAAVADADGVGEFALRPLEVLLEEAEDAEADIFLESITSACHHVIALL